MTAQNRTQLYTYFETGDTPSQAQFANLIDSSLNIADTSGQAITSDVSALKNLDVRGNFTVSGASTYAGALTVNNSALTTLTGNVNIGGALVVSAAGGASTFSSLIVTGSATFQGGITLPSSANASVTGNIAVTGLTTPTGGIKGTATNDAAAAGNVGELISAQTGPTAISSTTLFNATSISLTAGDWDVNGTIYYAPAGGTTSSAIYAAINTTSASLPTYPGSGGVQGIQAAQAAGADIILGTGTMRISIASPTTVYLVGFCAFAVSTMSATGFIRARRMR